MMTKFLIGITDYVAPPFLHEQKVFGSQGSVISLRDQSNRLSIEKLRQCDALLVWHEEIGSKIISELHRCKIVVRYGVGFDAIDLDSLESAGIKFSNTPDYGTEEVADTAVSMILMAHRGILEYNEISKNLIASWQESTIKNLTRSSETTIGVVGLGRIGISVINRLKPFGFKIIGYDPYVANGFEKAIGFERAFSLGDLLSSSNIVTLHCPLSSETRGMVNDKFLSQMRVGSTLVNTARGELIESMDVIERALHGNRLYRICLDVLPKEPPQPHPLIEKWRGSDCSIRSRLLINPHAAYYSMSSWVEMRASAAKTAMLFLEKGIHRNRVR